MQDVKRSPQGTTATVLVVDDSPVFLNLTRKILERADYGVRTASGAPQAIAEAGRALPDLIILDVEMPEMDGLSACAALNADAATRGVPVIMLTATQDTKLNERAFKAGACATVVKGVSADSLVNVVRLALATRSTGRDSAA